MSASRYLVNVFLLAAVVMSSTVSADWDDGLEAYELRDYETAEAEFRMVVHNSPDYAGGRYMLGLCQLIRGRRDEALANLRRAQELEPFEPRYLITLAKAEIQAKEYPTAYARLIEVDILDWDPDLVGPYRMLVAEAAIETNRAEVAVEVLQIQLAEYGESGEVFEMLGRALEKLGRDDEAVVAYLRAFDLDRRLLGPEGCLRAILLALAIVRDDASKGMNPGVVSVANYLASEAPGRQHLILAGRVNLQVGRFEQAAEWFEMALRLRPDDPEVLYLRASALTRLGRTDEAYENLNDALRLRPDARTKARIYAEMARIDERSLDLEAAAEDQLKAGDDHRAQQIEELKQALVEPLALRESYTEQARELRQAAGDSGIRGEQLDAGSLGRTISGLEGNVALIDEELEQARKVLKTSGVSPQTQQTLQSMNNSLLRRLIRPNPEDLGLTPLDIDELVVIVRPDRALPAAAPAGPPELRMLHENGKEVPLPLHNTEVNARINAYIASVEVKQEYRNPYDKKIEAVYAFPLPQDASVNEFVMTIGSRKIRGIIREREEAEQIYEEARKRGHVASLLTQERPNIFVQSIANIEPKKEISVAITYYNTLPYRDGAYEFSFPTVIGPRFNPPGSADPVAAPARGAQQGKGAEIQYLAPDEISSHKISVSVDLEAGIPIENVTSATHGIQIERVSPSHRRITLAESETLPNRDFVLRWEVDGDLIKSAFLVHEGEDGQYFTLVITPPRTETEISRSPVEHVFVIDCSGSMKGEPLKMAKRAVRRALEHLEPTDTFQIIRFSFHASALGRKPVPASPRAIQRGFEYLESLEADGGTMMIEGVKAALDFPHRQGAVRLVSLMTDGFIGNETEILAAVQEKLGDSRIFSFGVGSAPNRFLLERLARLGQGAVAYLTLDDGASDAAIDDFLDRVSHPVLSEIKIDWEGMDVREVYPARVPDLHWSQPVILTGRVEGRMVSYINVSGYSGGRRTKFSVPLAPEDHDTRPELAHVWARMKIAELAEQSLWAQDRDSLVGKIRELALQYGVMSKYTAFLAVDATGKTAGDPDVSVVQAVPVPAGVSYETTVKKEESPEPK